MWKPKRHQSRYPTIEPGPFARLLEVGNQDFTPMYILRSWDIASPMIFSYEVSMGREIVYRRYNKVREFLVTNLFEYFTLDIQRVISRNFVRPMDLKMSRFRKLTPRNSIMNGKRIHVNLEILDAVRSSVNHEFPIEYKNGWHGSLRFAEFYKDGVLQGVKCLVCGEQLKLPFTDHGVFPTWKDWKDIHDIHRGILSPDCARGKPAMTTQDLNVNGAII